MLLRKAGSRCTRSSSSRPLVTQTTSQLCRSRIEKNHNTSSSGWATTTSDLDIASLGKKGGQRARPARLSAEPNSWQDPAKDAGKRFEVVCLLAARGVPRTLTQPAVILFAHGS